MNWDLIKKGISKEIASTINTIDPAINIENCLNIYLQILKFKNSIPTINNLDGLENSIIETLTENFIDGNISDSSVGIFCKNFEQFIKKIYYILEEGEYVKRENMIDQTKLKALIPYLSVLNKIRPIYLDQQNKDVDEQELAYVINGDPVFKINTSGDIIYKKLYSNSLSFDSYNSVDDPKIQNDFPNDFRQYLIKSVILKNEQSHQTPERSRLANVTNLNTTLIAELWIINFFKKELATVIKMQSYKNRNLDEYVKIELERIKNQSSRFVSLRLKEVVKNGEKNRNGFIENLLDENLTRIRILGQGGSGKTTTLEYLFYKDALNWLDSPTESKLPILISLANLSENETILDNIAKKINTSNVYVRELLNTNDIKLYLDGVNEIVENRESKKLKLVEITSLLEEYEGLQLVITDRYEFDSYQSNMFDIPTFIIQKLTKDQIEEFVLKYCNNNQKLANHVLRILQSKENIQEILLRPLVLTRAIEIIKIDNDLPEKEGQIIEKFLDILLRREKDEKKDPLLNISSFKLLLSYAANEIWKKHTTNATVHEFAFNKMLVDASSKYGLEKFNAGYVSRIGCELEILTKNDESIQFYHQSYIEFFCKHYLKYEYQ